MINNIKLLLVIELLLLVTQFMSYIGNLLQEEIFAITQFCTQYSDQEYIILCTLAQTYLHILNTVPTRDTYKIYGACVLTIIFAN